MKYISDSANACASNKLRLEIFIRKKLNKFHFK